MGRAMDQVLLQEAVDLARKLWHAYIIEPSDESVQFIVDTMDPQNLSLIGTGKHELYVNLEAFFAGLERDQEEAQDITFEILDEYYEPRAIGEDTCIVFGTLWARERPDRPKPLLVEMDTRFTLVFRREGDRCCWCICIIPRPTSINGAKSTIRKRLPSRRTPLWSIPRLWSAAPSLIL